ncbi:MAG: UDP-N-acetylmuramoyl-L-alanine--D-glutamate ligase [Parachlamydiaceae bacterium]|nr:UDP-N-acetylmuramoyl-L-alanine--D-glutamate ligase [Parachlamydiaceae bacterium]
MMGPDFSNKKILIIGMGLSGRSAALFLLENNASVLGVDSKMMQLQLDPEIHSLIKKGLVLNTDQSNLKIDKFDFVVLSPGVSPDHELVSLAKQENIPVLGEIELGCQILKNKELLGQEIEVFGITGTNGKTTVSLLLSHLFNECGYRASALGNVGVPLTKELLKLNQNETIILELSSFQLETLQQKILDCGIILNITPDHLDRYKNMEEYAKAKIKMIRCLKKNAPLYIHEDCWKEFSHLDSVFSPRLYGYQSTSFIFTDLEFVYKEGIKKFKLPSLLANKKSIDLENLLAAYALLSQKEMDVNAFLKAWESFKKPAHRMQSIAHFQGVEFIDDSKGTNIDAVVRAVESIHGPIVLIAGGVDKGTSFKEWTKSLKNKVKLVCTIGQAADKIEEELTPDISVLKFSSLEEAVKAAFDHTNEGDTVLLSPGCASLDMFRNYAHRGELFQKIVLNLVEQKKDLRSGK